MVHLPKVDRARRKAALPEPEFITVKEAFKPQRQMLMLKDVTVWANKDKRTGKKIHLNTGMIYYVDDVVADEFILKGYADGELSRAYSDDEVAEIRSAIQNINMPGARNG